MDRLFREVRALYQKEGGKFPEPIVKANWNYTPKGEHEPSPFLVAQEINGYTWSDRKQVKNFVSLKDDGSTACGNWLYSGSVPGDNMMARREMEEGPGGIGMYPEWSWCWPLNRRIIYNRPLLTARASPGMQNVRC
jgi:formate dehydrogenase major subunit